MDLTVLPFCVETNAMNVEFGEEDQEMLQHLFSSIGFSKCRTTPCKPRGYDILSRAREWVEIYIYIYSCKITFSSLS